MRGLDVGDGELGVVLEGVERFVTEQFLDVVHARAAPEHFRGAAPPECARRDSDGQQGTHLSLVKGVLPKSNADAEAGVPPC